MNSLTHQEYDCDIFVVTIVTILEQKQYTWKKDGSFVLKCCYSREKYLSKLKQFELPDGLSKEFLFKCLSLMSYEQFIVSIVELIMLSCQQKLPYNFHNMRVTWLFYHFLKLKGHILQGLKNVSIFNVWKLWLVRCDAIFGETSLIYLKISESFWRKESPRVSLTQLQSLITWERFDRFQWYTYSSKAFWTLFHIKSTCFHIAVLI